MITIAAAVVTRADEIAETRGIPADLVRAALWAEVRHLRRTGQPITQQAIDAMQWPYAAARS